MTEDKDTKVGEPGPLTKSIELELVHMIEFVSISVFIIAGAFLAAAGLTGAVIDGEIGSELQLVFSSIGGGGLLIGGFMRWLLGRWG